MDPLPHSSQLLPKHTDTCSHKHLDPTVKGPPLASHCVSPLGGFSHTDDKAESARITPGFV